MICKPCRDQDHDSYPEKARQRSKGLSDVTLAGGSWCDCQHLVPA